MARRTARRRPAFGRRPLPYRIGWAAGRILLGFLLASVAMVVIYRFVSPPITWTMLGDMAGGRAVAKDWMPLSAMDPDMARAAIAAEDGNFCRHHGFDATAIRKAMEGNLTGRRFRGGSTISQQTAKNVFLWQGRSWLRKGLEAYFTVLIELLWDKKRIIEVYLNVAETGIATYGANAGAQRYFHHDASRLTPVEAARIAAILPLPKRREAIDPAGQVRRYGNAIAVRMPKMQRAGFYACLS